MPWEHLPSGLAEKDMALQAAFGTWPSESSHSRGGLNEGFSFGVDDTTTDTHPLCAASVFKLSSKALPAEGTIIPPFFVPPGDSTAAHPNEATPAGRRQAQQAPSRREDGALDTGLCAPDTLSAVKVTNPPVDASMNSVRGNSDDRMNIDDSSRSPSPEPLSESSEQERQSLWSKDSRAAFHEMVTAEGYVARYRMHMKKKQRMIHQLEHPDLEITLCDGSKDHQTKYQSANWTLMNGLLYRKPESGRVGKLRRHLDELEAWDVLTREHLRSGHLGRDKLRKRLEQRYIGYTLQEIMFVLKECRRCGGHEKRSPLANEASNESVAASPSAQPALSYGNDVQSLDATSTPLEEPFKRGQLSNFMWP
ncbi:uncharacterized protein LTR77_006702 [Saxophila tyrrhenica]|uniref:Integrase zinc-binding domain-containing protein n=1 Tax=Saxophila tyrrhenica TaxID=1690608 RepID=A0AAV9P5J6_9PEZI|nr:hypothetical protein LTR77_006702 [Saxophila tyrrhenica]